MKMNIQIVVAVLCGIWILLGDFSWSAGTPFLKCANGTQKCTNLGCTECKYILIPGPDIAKYHIYIDRDTDISVSRIVS